MNSRNHARSAVLLLVLAATVTGAFALSLVRVEELPALVAESRRAVLARVTSVHYGFDENRLHATFVTLAVDERLYGAHAPPAGERLEIKLYGAPVALDDGSRMFLDGTPRYSIGDRLLLLLRDDSSHGFTNVPGLFQGAFRITQPDGALWAESLGGNANVFGEGGLGRWLDPQQAGAHAAHLTTTDGPVPYPLLRDTILRLWLEQGGAP